MREVRAMSVDVNGQTCVSLIARRAELSRARRGTRVPPSEIHSNDTRVRAMISRRHRRSAPQVGRNCLSRFMSRASSKISRLRRRCNRNFDEVFLSHGAQFYHPLLRRMAFR